MTTTKTKHFKKNKDYILKKILLSMMNDINGIKYCMV